MTDRYDPNDPLADIEPYQTGPVRQTPQHQPAHGGGYGTTPNRSPLLTGLVLALLLVVVSIALFQLLGADGDEVAGSTQPPADTGVPGTTLAGEEGDGSTTAPDDSGAETTETESTLADGNGGTSVETGAGQPYEAVGDPIPVANLQLAVDGVGEIQFGTPAESAIGRLVSSLGEPESDTGVQVSDGTWGTCAGESERIVRWGPFAAIVAVDPDGTETFAGYRFDLSYGLSQPAVDMATLSGLQAGESYRRLGQIYEGFEITQEQDDDLGGLVWKLSSTNTGNLLLWGPLTAEETVRGIYAPDACGRF